MTSTSTHGILMRKVIRGLLLGGVVIATAGTTYSTCWDYCHERSMWVYEESGYGPAAAYFHGCMDTCGKNFTPIYKA